MSAHDNNSRRGLRLPVWESAYKLAGEVEAAVAEAQARFPLGMGPIERVQARRLLAAAQRLRECADELAVDPLMVRGSTGQQRPHPLLKVEQDLRRELATGVADLIFRAENRAIVERLRPRHRTDIAAATEPESEA
jgi:hypothetical protein